MLAVLTQSYRAKARLETRETIEYKITSRDLPGRAFFASISTVLRGFMGRLSLEIYSRFGYVSDDARTRVPRDE